MMHGARVPPSAVSRMHVAEMETTIAWCFLYSQGGGPASVRTPRVPQPAGRACSAGWRVARDRVRL